MGPTSIMSISEAWGTPKSCGRILVGPTSEHHEHQRGLGASEILRTDLNPQTLNPKPHYHWYLASGLSAALWTHHPPPPPPSTRHPSPPASVKAATPNLLPWQPRRRTPKMKKGLLCSFLFFQTKTCLAKNPRPTALQPEPP